MSKSQAQLKQGHIISLGGALTNQTIVSMLAQLKTLIDSIREKHYQVDLQAVTQVDSAGLSLLIHIVRLSKQQHKSVKFYQSPAQLKAIAILSGVDKVLNI